VQKFFRSFFEGKTRRVRLGLGIGLVCLLIILSSGWIPSTFGQSPNRIPKGVNRLGTVEVAPIEFDGSVLFTVASPTIWDRSKPGDKIPVEVRVDQIESNLNRVIEGSLTDGKKNGFYTYFDPKTLQVTVSAIDQVPIIIAVDGYHSQPIKLASITYLDADYNGMPVAELAEEWRSILYQHLYEALMERSPEAVKARLGDAVLVIGSALGASVVLWLLQTVLKAGDRRLRAKQVAAAVEVSSDPGEASGEDSLPSRRLTFLNVLQRQFRLQRYRNLYIFFDWLLGWAQVAVWFTGISVALRLSPWTRPLAENLLGAPAKLLVIWFLTALINRISGVVLSSVAKTWARRGFSPDGDGLREFLRVSTFTEAIKGAKTLLLYAIGSVVALKAIGLPMRLIVAIALVVVVVIALIVRYLLKDVIAGCLILREDQYAIGDVVAIGDVLGLVERMNLRSTQIRDVEGELITLANSSITQVRNLTRTWSQIDFKIEVPYATDIQRAIAVIKSVAEEMYEEPEWHERILERPEVLGVDDLSPERMLIRVWIKTQPLQQWRVGREFRLRLRVALDDYQLSIETPQPTLWHQDEPALRNGTDSITPVAADDESQEALQT
jgi:small-conductance mechanosensitive channel